MIRVQPADPAAPDGPWTAISACPAATDRLGRQLAVLLPAGAVISLEGGMGAGKTALTRGLAAGLRCLGPVASPTYTLLMEHPAAAGGLALYHFDAYRLDGPDEFCELGLQEYFHAGGICVIEWGDLIAEILPRQALILRMSQPDEDKPLTRRIVLTWPEGRRQLAALTAALSEPAAGPETGKDAASC